MEFQALLDSIIAYSWLVYLLVFAVMFVESAGAPIPGLTLVMVAAAFAGQGKLDIWLVVLANLVGSTLGGMVGYAIGEYGGRSLLLRYGRYILITPARLEQGERYLQQHGNKAILLSRYLPVLCFLFGVLGGMARLPYRPFVIYNFLGIFLWSVTHLTAAFFFGRSLDVLFSTVNSVGLIICIVVGFVVVLYITRRYLLTRRRSSVPERVVPDES